MRLSFTLKPDLYRILKSLARERDSTLNAAQRKEDRIAAHEQRNAEAAYEAAVRRMDAKMKPTAKVIVLKVAHLAPEELSIPMLKAA